MCTLAWVWDARPLGNCTRRGGTAIVPDWSGQWRVPVEMMTSGAGRIEQFFDARGAHGARARREHERRIIPKSPGGPALDDASCRRRRGVPGDRRLSGEGGEHCSWLWRRRASSRVAARRLAHPERQWQRGHCRTAASWSKTGAGSTLGPSCWIDGGRTCRALC